MPLQILTPKVRGFICTNAHPIGCAWNVAHQASFVRAALREPSRDLNVLIIGASTGYGLASRIVAAFGYKARTIGVFHERSPEGEKTATAGYYNSAAFHQEAHENGLYSCSFNGDAFSNDLKKQVIDQIRADMGGIDYVIYSLASPRRLHPETGLLHSSVIKPIGGAFTAKSVDVNTGMIHDACIEPASEEEISDTQQVMGGQDWKFWIEALREQNLLRPGARTVAYSYIGPEQTWPVYRSGTIGRAKDHLESTAKILDHQLQDIGGNAWVSINKAVITQSSAAIPVVPLYLAILYPLMRQHALHEDCIDQMTRLFTDHIGPDVRPVLDAQRRIRLDDKEMHPLIQQPISERWKGFRSGDLLPEFSGYREEFHRLFGFAVPGVDYDSPTEIAPTVNWRPNLQTSIR